MLAVNKPNTVPVSCYIGIPDAALKKENEEMYNSNIRTIRDFVAAFKITDENTDTWVGKRGWAVLKAKESKEGYGVQSKVQKFLPPR
jgi:hypothetical protein